MKQEVYNKLLEQYIIQQVKMHHSEKKVKVEKVLTPEGIEVTSDVIYFDEDDDIFIEFVKQYGTNFNINDNCKDNLFMGILEIYDDMSENYDSTELLSIDISIRMEVVKGHKENILHYRMEINISNYENYKEIMD